MPVMVLASANTGQISRFMRASMLDNLNQDYVRTARAKGLSENVVVLVHVLRNSMIPVITVIALGVPTSFRWRHHHRTVFKVNGLGQLLIIAIQAGDVPTVQTLTFIFAVLIVLFNLVADCPVRHCLIRGFAMTDSSAIPTEVTDDLKRPARAQWRDVWDQFKAHKGALVGMIFFVFILIFVYSGTVCLVNRPDLYRHPGPQFRPQP